MSVSRAVARAQEGSSWIRRMFEEGVRLKARLGAENVADLALGNPVVEPPAAVLERLRVLVAEPASGRHRYMPNAGFPSTRAAVAAHLARRTGVPYGPEDVVMTVGAGGGLNVIFKAMLDPGDEVIVLAPYFVEYRFYVDNHGGRVVLVDTDEEFLPDVAAIDAAIGPRTRAVLINSPNNPTGAVYPAGHLDALAEVLARRGAEFGRTIHLISDEPYRAIAYDGIDVPWPVRHVPDTIHVTSFSKDLAIPGERIGYVAVNPTRADARELANAMTFATRILGFVNAPALQQRLVEGLLDVGIELAPYAEKRARLLAALERHGYPCVRPGGAFYLFPRVPVAGMDDVEFVRACVEERLLVVPGSGFGRAGHVRLSYAVTDRDIDLACEALGRVAARVGATAR